MGLIMGYYFSFKNPFDRLSGKRMTDDDAGDCAVLRMVMEIEDGDPAADCGDADGDDKDGRRRRRQRRR